MTEQVLCLAKRCAEDDPRWAGWVDVMRREGSKIWFRPPPMSELPKEGIDREVRPPGWEFKLLPHVAREKPDEVTVTISGEGARSFLSDSAGWGAIGLQEVDEALWEALGKPERSELRPSAPPEDRLRDQVAEDRTAWNYWATCEGCGAEMGVNMLGMGKCPSCGRERNPMKKAAD